MSPGFCNKIRHRRGNCRMQRKNQMYQRAKYCKIVVTANFSGKQKMQKCKKKIRPHIFPAQDLATLGARHLHWGIHWCF